MRIRNIKPEFWRSEDVTSLPLSARLTFIGLWSYVDDNGVGEDRVVSIAADLFADDLSVDPHQTLVRLSSDIDRLQEGGQIVRYTAGRKRLFYVTNWEAHQYVRHPSKGHCYPLPPAETVEHARSLVRPSSDTHQTRTPGTGGQGDGVTGGQGVTLSPLDAPRRPARDADTFPPISKLKKTNGRYEYPDPFIDWWRTYPKHKNGSMRDAYAEWQKAVRDIAPDELLRLTSTFAANPGVSSTAYCPDADRWLKRRKWETVTETDQQVTRPQTGQGYTPEEWRRPPPPEDPGDIIDGEVIDPQEFET